MNYDRDNANYRMPLRLCRLVLEGMLLSSGRGELSLARFLDDRRMCALYEAFLLAYCVRHYPQLSPRASFIDWALDDEERSLLPRMRSDVTLELGDRALVIDAKYYSRSTQERYGRESLHSGNLYQIYAYVKNKRAEPAFRRGEVSGLLLYAGTGAALQPRVEYRMEGNRIGARVLDLNRDFPSIAASLDQVVRDHFGPVARSGG